ncbi:MAG TPA: amidohydrolase family protein [Steroidobacteraceae bacterium]|nr:amidohydrolase family protein [Steroidobacteraceae bacterium]
MKIDENVADKTVAHDANAWRRQTPGHQGWPRAARAGAPKKFFMVSADTHITPPKDLIKDRIAAVYRDRLPRMEVTAAGDRILHIEGAKPSRLVPGNLEGEDAYRAHADVIGDDPETDVARRMADLEKDGVDAELIFPNGPALGAFWTPDPSFAQAQFRIYNEWAAEITKPHRARMKMAACIATGDVDLAVKEVAHAAKLGFDVLTLPSVPSTDNKERKYNNKEFDPLWAAIQDADLTMTFHVATAGDPRAARGPGGAIINRAHSHQSVTDPLAALCTSGVLDRYPKLRFVSVEAGIGWIPALLDLMDETYHKHHMWVRPKLLHGLPSDYFRANGGATFEEDRSGLLLVEPYNLTDNFCWANDYPHHEGTFPHSAAAIEREMGHLEDETRAKLLGLNAARLFKFPVPKRYA